MENQPTKKPKFNLNYVVSETGINADTLRAWERRYGLPNPERTRGGHRLFSESDIETINWLFKRQKEGLSIKRAVDLWFEIESKGQNPLVSQITSEHRISSVLIPDQEMENIISWRDKWIKACLDFDELSAEQILAQSFARFSMETACVGIIQSGIAEIGTAWYRGEVSVQQEHFISEIAMRRLQSLLISAPQPFLDKTIIIGCSQGENHTFSILLLSLLLRYRGFNIIYLGADVPMVRLQETIEITNPDLIVMASMSLVTSATLFELAKYLLEINIPLAFGGGIFDSNPTLVQRVSGHYLGPDLPKAISKIEYLLSHSLPDFSPGKEDNGLSDLRLQFIKNQYLIKNQTLQLMREKFAQTTFSEFIESTTDQFTKDIIASLILGDLSFISINIKWMDGLMKNQGFPEDLFNTFVETYSDSVTSYLGKVGIPINLELTSIIGETK